MEASMPLHEAKTLLRKNMTEHITPQGDPVMTSNGENVNYAHRNRKVLQPGQRLWLHRAGRRIEGYLRWPLGCRRGRSQRPDEGQKVEYEVVSKPDGETAARNLKLAD